MDHATPNLPSRDFEATSQFYAKLGFEETWRDRGWMILKRDGLALEFFPYPDLDPLESSFGSCLRLDDVAAFYETCRDAGIPEARAGQPRLKAPQVEHQRTDNRLFGRSRRKLAPPRAELTVGP